MSSKLVEKPLGKLHPSIAKVSLGRSGQQSLEKDAKETLRQWGGKNLWKKNMSKEIIYIFCG